MIPEAASQVSAGGYDAVRPGFADRLRRAASSWPRKTVFWVGLFDVLLIFVFGAISEDHSFLTLESFQNLGLNGAQIALLTVGQVYLLGAREFDISMGANLVLSSVVGGKVMVALSGSAEQVASGVYPRLWLGLVVGTLACVLSGLAVGVVNGWVVTRLKVNSLVTTLATLGIATGLAAIVNSGADVQNVPIDLQVDFGVANLFGLVPYPVLVSAVVTLVAWWVLNKTRFGLYTLSIGSSRESADRAGIRVDRHLFALFVIAGALAGLAGFLDLTRFATTNISGHQTDALAAIAAAVIGGTALTGGVASVGGGVIGVLLAVILETGLLIVNVEDYYQLVVVGVVLIVAVHMDYRRRRPV